MFKEGGGKRRGSAKKKLKGGRENGYPLQERGGEGFLFILSNMNNGGKRGGGCMDLVILYLRLFSFA